MKLSKPFIILPILLLAACASKDPKFGVETLDSVEKYDESLVNRGRAACDIIQEMERSGTLQDQSFPIYSIASDKLKLQSFGKKLAESFVGEDVSPNTDDPERLVYSKDGKSLTVHLDDFEINFTDESSVPSNDVIPNSEVIKVVKKFVRSYDELGPASDYYIYDLTGSEVGGSAGVNSSGSTEVESFVYSQQLTAHRVANQLPLLGGIGSFLVDVRPDKTIGHFKIKFLGVQNGNKAIAGAELLTYNAAKAKVEQQLDNPNDYNLSCEFGYIPNRIKGTPEVVVPGYILKAVPVNAGKATVVIVPAIDDASIHFDYVDSQEEYDFFIESDKFLENQK